jgi:gas vesicle protein
MDKNVLLGILGGFVAGALVGVLLAPHEGSETVNRLTESGEDYLSELKNKYSRIIGELTEKLDDLREKASEVSQSPVDARFTV